MKMTEFAIIVKADDNSVHEAILNDEEKFYIKAVLIQIFPNGMKFDEKELKGIEFKH